MRVLVTGGTGSVGRATVPRLVTSGHELLVVGRRPEMEVEGARYAACDVTDYEAVCDAVRGCDAIVHLAAIPTPGSAPGQEVFRANAQGTYHVYEAAARAGIRRVVQASSINALGCAYGTVPLAPQYLPIDEAHPTCTTDPYSFSKNVVEEIAHYYWRREGISGVSLRLPWVRHAPSDPEKVERWQRHRAAERAAIDELAAAPEAERVQRLATLRAWFDECRSHRPQEHQRHLPDEVKARRPQDPAIGAYTSRFNLWTLIDDRDAAQAIEKGLVADYEGSHTLYVNARDNWLGCDSATLARLFYPEAVCPRPLEGAESLVSPARAADVIGFEPEYGPGNP